MCAHPIDNKTVMKSLPAEAGQYQTFGTPWFFLVDCAYSDDPFDNEYRPQRANYALDMHTTELIYSQRKSIQSYA